MQPSHHAHPITLSPVAQAIPGKPRFKKQAGDSLQQLLLLDPFVHTQALQSFLSALRCSVSAADSPSLG